MDDIHTKILDKRTTLNEFNTFLNEISIRYNIDMRTLLQKYFNYLIRKGFTEMTKNINDISNVLDKIKIIIHRPDIPINILVEYLYLNFVSFTKIHEN